MLSVGHICVLLCVCFSPVRMKLYLGIEILISGSFGQGSDIKLFVALYLLPRHTQKMCFQLCSLFDPYLTNCFPGVIKNEDWPEMGEKV